MREYSDLLARTNLLVRSPYGEHLAFADFIVEGLTHLEKLDFFIEHFSRALRSGDASLIVRKGDSPEALTYMKLRRFAIANLYREHRTLREAYSVSHLELEELEWALNDLEDHSPDIQAGSVHRIIRRRFDYETSSSECAAELAQVLEKANPNHSDYETTLESFQFFELNSIVGDA